MNDTINVQNLSKEIAGQVVICNKEVLTSEEAARYMGYSMSGLYKLTMRRVIPHYKPTGRSVFFNRKELEAWLQTNRVSTDEELTAKAEAYCRRGGVR